jgi:predicted DNA-binding protein (MmcQ/YjbR family)
VRSHNGSVTSQRDRVLRTCLDRPGAVQEFPFGDGVAVFKVGGKMFALVSLDAAPGDLSLKVDPDRGEALRAEHPAIVPGYHLNKRHWVTIPLDGSITARLLVELIEDSHDLVVASLPRAKRPG